MSSRMVYGKEGDPGVRTPDQYWRDFNRSVKSKRGQQALRLLREALLAMPVKALARGTIAHAGQVCAVGALAAHRLMRAGESWDAAVRQMDLGPDEWSGQDTVEIAIRNGFSNTVAWDILEANDGAEIHEDTGTSPSGRIIVTSRIATPEERYAIVLAWVNDLIVEEEER